jgi:hypothetical protein
MRVRSQAVTVNGEVMSRPAGRRQARIDMRGMPARRVAVRITASLAGGRVLSARRAYRTCSARIQAPPLPTLHLLGGR